MQKQRKKVIGFNMIEVIVIIIISSLTCCISTGVITINNFRTSVGPSYASLLNDENVKNFLDVYAEVVEGYYKDVDKDKAMDSAISGMMSYLGDKYTTYLDDDESSVLNDKLSGVYKGIGISMGNGAVIKEVFEDSPAEKAGLQANDIILSVNGVSVKEKSLDEISELIQNAKNEVKLTIQRDINSIAVTVKIEEINVPAAYGTVLENGDNKVGYLLISTFSATLNDQVKKILVKLENQEIDGLIIDVRKNGGGYLVAASDVASLFIEKGKPIYSLEGKDGLDTYFDETSDSRNYPIVVLVDNSSASASEILTAALKDTYGAKVVGLKTYGKGRVQQTKSLNDGGMVKYTTARWLRPNGECVDNIGIIPDYIVSLEGAQSDVQLEKALEVIFE